MVGREKWMVEGDSGKGKKGERRNKCGQKSSESKKSVVGNQSNHVNERESIVSKTRCKRKWREDQRCILP